MSEYQVKSKTCEEAANYSHSKAYYAAVGHTAYFSCFLLVEHIFYYTLSRTKAYLNSKCVSTTGSHEVMINDVILLIKTTDPLISSVFDRNITRLKALRISADYRDIPFDKNKADESIRLMNAIIPILSKY